VSILIILTVHVGIKVLECLGGLFWTCESVAAFSL